MRVREVTEPLEDRNADAFERFEAEFTYPLGPERRFHLSHGRDPRPFFGAMGPSTCFLAEEGGRIAGSASVALRRLLDPDGTELVAAYVGDLKVAAWARGGRAVLCLTRAIESWGRPHTDRAFAIVMDGTPLTPLDYTGRAGIPAFEEVAKVVLFRIAAATDPAGALAVVTGRDEVLRLYRRCTRGRFSVLPGEPGPRSFAEPLWLALPGGRACGCLEDTRKAKRLIAEDGSEISSAHLSAFAFETASEGARLIAAARQRAHDMRLETLFVSAPAEEAEPLREALGCVERVEAPATIFATGLPRGHSWIINTSEI